MCGLEFSNINENIFWQVTVMFVTLDKIAQADPKYADILLLENYAAFQNRYWYQSSLTYDLNGIMLFIIVLCLIFDFCGFYGLWNIIFTSWIGLMQSVWSGQCCTHFSKVLSPSKWSLWTGLHSFYKLNYIICKLFSFMQIISLFLNLMHHTLVSHRMSRSSLRVSFSLLSLSYLSSLQGFNFQPLIEVPGLIHEQCWMEEYAKRAKEGFDISDL